MRSVKRRSGRRTGGKSALLEHSVNVLHALAFHEYASKAEFDRAQVLPPKYVIRNYPHESLYGTGGKKEAFISAPKGRDLFLPNSDGRIEVIVEAKWQEESGSTDEKFPYVWESFLASKIVNWVVVVDGKYWKTRRGQAAVAWLKEKTPGPSGRLLYVVDRKGFAELVTNAWGNLSNELELGVIT